LIGFCKQTSPLCMVHKYDDFSLRTTHKNATSGHSTNIGGVTIGRIGEPENHLQIDQLSEIIQKDPEKWQRW